MDESPLQSTLLTAPSAYSAGGCGAEGARPEAELRHQHDDRDERGTGDADEAESLAGDVAEYGGEDGLQRGDGGGPAGLDPDLGPRLQPQSCGRRDQAG